MKIVLCYKFAGQNLDSCKKKCYHNIDKIRFVTKYSYIYILQKWSVKTCLCQKH